MSNQDSSQHEPDRVENTSLPSDFCISFLGFDENRARVTGEKMAYIIKSLGAHLPLENLDGVTVAIDYQKALAELDRGHPDQPNSLEPTDDPIVGIGIAMALPVNRDGVLKTHIVFSPMIAAYLFNEDDNEGIRAAIDLIAHELGHVVDNEWKYRRFGNYAFQTLDDFVSSQLDRYLWQLSSNVWGEYCANRIASMLVQRTSDDLEVFIKARDTFVERITSARLSYHRNLSSLEDFLSVLASNLRIVLCSTGNLLGRADAHPDGEGVDPTIQTALDASESAPYVGFQPCLRDLWDRHESWDSYSEFMCLNKPTLDLLHKFEIYPKEIEDGQLYIDVPYEPFLPLLLSDDNSN